MGGGSGEGGWMMGELSCNDDRRMDDYPKCCVDAGMPLYFCVLFAPSRVDVFPYRVERVCNSGL